VPFRKAEPLSRGYTTVSTEAAFEGPRFLSRHGPTVIAVLPQRVCRTRRTTTPMEVGAWDVLTGHLFWALGRRRPADPYRRRIRSGRGCTKSRPYHAAAKAKGRAGPTVLRTMEGRGGRKFPVTGHPISTHCGLAGRPTRFSDEEERSQASRNGLDVGPINPGPPLWGGTPCEVRASRGGETSRSPTGSAAAAGGPVEEQKLREALVVGGFVLSAGGDTRFVLSA